MLQAIKNILDRIFSIEMTLAALFERLGPVE
jgi:hypothetical protein